MNRLFKGAVAGAAGVALLLGGAGTFALWQDAASIGDSTAINSGQLRFGTVPEGAWAFNGNAIVAADVEDLLIVPGDVLTYTVANVPILANGDNLSAVLGFTTGSATGDADLIAALDPVVTVNGVDVTGGTVTVTDGMTNVGPVVVTMAFEADNLDAQNMVAYLSDMQLTLNQQLVPGQPDYS